MERPSHLHARPVGEFGAVEPGPSDEGPTRPLGHRPLPRAPQLPLAPPLGHAPPGIARGVGPRQPQRPPHLGLQQHLGVGIEVRLLQGTQDQPLGLQCRTRGHRVSPISGRGQWAKVVSMVRPVRRVRVTGVRSAISANRDRCSSERSPDTVMVRSIRSTLVAPSRCAAAGPARPPHRGPIPSGWRTSATSPPCTAPGRTRSSW